MGLSEDLKTNFKNEHNKLFLNILYTSNYLTGRMNDFFKPYNLTRQQYNVLRIIRGQKGAPATVNLIKDRMIDKMSDASRIVGRLTLKGYVRRENNQSDKRAAAIVLTKEGITLLKKLDKKIDRFDKLFEFLSDEEAARVNDILDGIRS